MLVGEVTSIPHLEQTRIDGILEVQVNGVSTDSRTVARGNIFVALRGERFNGHEFVDQAFLGGALLAVVDQKGVADVHSQIPLLIVADTTGALGDLATRYRARFDIPVIGIAGSNGKTTTKDMVAAVLSRKLNVLKTEGNLNNNIGVPMTLFQLDASHEVAVIEIGTNHPGELAVLCNIAAPTMGLISSIGREHLEFFNTLDGVEIEETALFHYLANRPGSTVFVNVDEPRIARHVPAAMRAIRYGIGAEAEIRGTIASHNEEDGAVLSFDDVRTRQHGELSLHIAGDHNALNALAAIAVGYSFEVPQPQIVEALEAFQPSSKRLEREVILGVTILNDTYNANPDSMLASLRVLASAHTKGKRIAVLGDMKELGESGPSEHARIGSAINSMGIEYVLGYGDLAAFLIQAVQGPFAVHYTQKNLMAEYLAELVSEGDVVLVKGSRSMKLEDVVIFVEERLRATATKAS